MKFSTAWGSLKPAKVIDDCSHKVGNDCAKIIILDSLYKVCDKKLCVFSKKKQKWFSIRLNEEWRYFQQQKLS